MTEKEIVQGNKLIIESPFASDVHKKWFNKWHEQEQNYRLGDDKFFERMQYHSSWDWLIPVCQKINSNESVIRVEMNGIEDSVMPYIQAMREMKAGALKFDLDMTWKGVVSFIEWYNKNKK